MKKVRLFTRKGWNEAGSVIELSDTQAEWMIVNGHAEPEKKAKDDAPAVEAEPEPEPVKLVDTSPTPEPPATAAPMKRKPGRPRRGES